MDAGDAGHILVSKGTAGLLEHLKRWAPHLDDLASTRSSMGKKIHFYNLYAGELGNPAIPAKFRAERDRARRGKTVRLVLAAVVVAALAAAGFVLYQIILADQAKTVCRRDGISKCHGEIPMCMGRWRSYRQHAGPARRHREAAATISGQECAEMWKNLGVPRFESLSKRALGQLKSFGADFVVVGFLQRSGESHRWRDSAEL